jgi:hypothetical protein
MGKIRKIISGNTVYEIDKHTKKPKHIMHDVDSYFKLHPSGKERNSEEDEEEIKSVKPISSREKFKKIHDLMGNKGKLVIKTEADGLDREIEIDDTDHEATPEKYTKYDTKYRKSKKGKPSKRKPVKKCRCKK